MVYNKNQQYCSKWPLNLMKTIQLVRTLDPKTTDIAFPVVQRNAFFSHPENIILSKITDPRKHIRQIGYRRIRKSRSNTLNKTVRKFQVPKLNFDAVSYTDLIDWQTVNVTEPPLTKNLSNEKLDELIVTGDIFPLPKYPNHTQSVERCIKLVTEASSLVTGTQRSDGLIRSSIISRKNFPRIESKADLM